MSNYLVSVDLSLKSNVLQALEQMVRELRTFEGTLTASTEGVDKLASAMQKLGRTSRGIDRLGEAMTRLRDASGGTGLTGSFDKAEAALRTMVSSGERLASVMRENAKLANDMARNTSRAASGAASGGGSRGHGGIGHRLPHSIDDGLKMIAGGAAVHVGSELLKAGADYGGVKAQLFSDTRFSDADKAKFDKAAYDTAKSVPGTTAVENMALLSDIKMVAGVDADPTKRADKLIALLPALAKLTATYKLIDRKNGGSGDPAFAALKAEEILGGFSEDGKIDVEGAQQKLEAIAKASNALGGRFKPQEFLSFAKRGSIAGMHMSQEFLNEIIPSLIAVEGGSIVGTASMSMEQVYNGGKLMPKTMEEMQKAGLADKRTGIRKVGKKEIVNENAIFDHDLLKSNPLEWVEKARDRMDKAGIHGQDAQLTALEHMGQRSTIARFLAILLKDDASLRKDQENIRSQPGDIGGYLQANDPNAKIQAFNASLENLKTALGESILPDVIKGMDLLTGGIKSLTDVVHANPDTAGKLTELAGAIVTISGALAAARMFGLLSGAKTAGGVAATAAAAAGTTGGVGALITGTVTRLASGLGVGLLWDRLEDLKSPMDNMPSRRARIARHGGGATPTIIDDLLAYKNGTPLPTEGTPASRHIHGIGGATAKPPIMPFDPGYMHIWNKRPEDPDLTKATSALNATVTKLNAIPLPPAVMQTIQVATRISLDSREIANAVTEHQVKQMDRPGNNGVDVRLGNLHPGDHY